MKSLLLLWKEVADESAAWCSTSATMDHKTVCGRVENEGLSFLTIALPQFGKDLERALDDGCVARHHFLGFKRKAGLPRFLGGFLERIFDRDSGVLLDDPCVDAIRAIRQLTLMFSKVLLPCSEERVEAAKRGFIKCEQEVRESDKRLSPIDLERFHRMSRLLFRDVFAEVDREVAYGEIIPKHGPGATADKLRGNGKYRQFEWTRRLEEVFPCGDFLLPNHRFYDELDDVALLEPGAERPMRVVTVPKTLKTPRIIGIEPTCMQYVQQGLLASILRSLKRVDFLDRMIGFDDQSPNQEMALIGSHTGELATLDLSEASDRVSNQLVRLMLSDHPHLHEAVDACRSRKADVDGEVVRLAKFAPMGSALCFPFEAMVFTTLIFMGIEDELSTQMTRRDVVRYVESVRVYGDDLIVPVRFVQSVVRTLEHFGARVNASKSFWSGKFRESCGRDYYDGVDVTVVRVRMLMPTHRQQAQEVISAVSLRNQLYFAGYWRTVRWLDDEIRAIIRWFPTVLPSSPVLGRHSFLGYETQKVGSDLFNPLVKGWVVKAEIPADQLDDTGALLKCLLRLEQGQDCTPTENHNSRFVQVETSPDERHLERAGRPRAVYTKPRYASAV